MDENMPKHVHSVLCRFLIVEGDTLDLKFKDMEDLEVSLVKY